VFFVAWRKYIPRVHLSDDAELGLDGGNLLGRGGLRAAAEAEERHFGGLVG
jgi:hypothetical protein